MVNILGPVGQVAKSSHCSYQKAYCYPPHTHTHRVTYAFNLRVIPKWVGNRMWPRDHRLMTAGHYHSTEKSINIGGNLKIWLIPMSPALRRNKRFKTATIKNAWKIKGNHPKTSTGRCDGHVSSNNNIIGSIEITKTAGGNSGIKSTMTEMK